MQGYDTSERTYKKPWLASVFKAGQGDLRSPGCGGQYACVFPVTGHVPTECE